MTTTIQTNPQTPAIVKGFRYVSIEGASGGFGEYQVQPNGGDEIYADATDLIAVCEPSNYVSTENADWRNDSDTELVAAIEQVTGRCHNEPEVLVAMRDYDDNVTVFGITTQDCYELKSGEYVEIAAYNNNPARYELKDVDNVRLRAEAWEPEFGADDILIDPTGDFDPGPREHMVADVEVHANTCQHLDGVRPDEQAIMGRMVTLAQYREAQTLPAVLKQAQAAGYGTVVPTLDKEDDCPIGDYIDFQSVPGMIPFEGHPATDSDIPYRWLGQTIVTKDGCEICTLTK